MICTLVRLCDQYELGYTKMYMENVFKVHIDGWFILSMTDFFLNFLSVRNQYRSFKNV